jgi:ribosomal protein L21
VKGMVMKFDRKLKVIYYKYRNKKNPPVPVKKIKKYLELEGVLDEDDDK